MKGYLDKHFDKVLLSALFVAGLLTHLYFARSAEFYSNAANAEHLSDIIRWLQEIDGQILAALLTLLVGRGLQASVHAEPNRADAAVGQDPPKEEK